jgi:hypothetical protein
VSRVPDHLIDEIRHRARVSDVVREIGGRTLKRAGREYVAECPFHADRKPSLTINDDKGLYKCFPCGASGDAFGFVMEYQGVGFLEAVAAVGALYGITVEAEISDGLSEADRARLRAERDRRRGVVRFFRGVQTALEARETLAAARRIWLDAQAAPDVPLRYLAGRGINLRGLPRAMRAHRALYHGPSDSRWPGLVSLLEGPYGVAGIHRTYLTTDGAKAPVDPAKMTLGPYLEAGACLRLQNAATRVALAEGIESALSAAQVIHQERQRSDDPQLHWPVWAVLCLEGFRKVVLPESIRDVLIMPDADENPEAKDGRRSAREAAREVIDEAVVRFQREGRTVWLFDTPDGKDLNDMLLEGLGVRP